MKIHISITTFFNFLCVTLLGLRQYELERLFKEQEKCSIENDKMHEEHEKRYYKHEMSITNINRHLVKHDTDILKINLKSFKDGKHQGYEEEKTIVLPKSQKFSVTNEEDNLMDGFVQLELEMGRFAEMENILLKDSIEASSNNHPKRRAIEVQNSDNIQTTCLLKRYDNSKFVQTFDHVHENASESSITFDLTLDLTSDRHSDSLSWSLVRSENETKLIDSKADVKSEELLASKSHTMVYSCLVTSTEEKELDKSKICYDFEMLQLHYSGLCCQVGIGGFSLRLDNEEEPLFSGTYYTYSKKVSFCLGNDSKNNDEEENFTNIYPSKECLKNEDCICDFKPNLLSNFDDIESKYPGLHGLKTRTMMNILILSGSKYLQDVTSPQYKAACWTLNDDPYLTQYGNTTAVKASDAEKRMIQRYILAVLYFSTNPQKWNNDFNFLSSKSECDWNYDDGLYIDGVGCDDKDSIISFHSANNLEGTIINEISGLKTLESLIFYQEELHGDIPSSIGLLSNLRYLALADLEFLEGTLAPELFNPAKLELLLIRGTMIHGTIPKAIGNLEGLQYLDLSENLLTGSLPKEMFSLSELRNFFLNNNMLSSSISSSIGNLKKINKIRLYNNYLTGQLPLELGYLSGLKLLNLSKNKFSSTIPQSFKSLTSVERIDLFETDLEGEVPDEICEIEPLPSITADCRNDVFTPDLSCSCCSYCTDKTPVWDGICPDVQLEVKFDHVRSGQWFSSELLQWSITDTATNRKLIGDGPYSLGVTLKQSYETCVASSDCLVLNMMADPLIEEHSNSQFAAFDFKTNYSIYWNENLVLKDTFELDLFNKTVSPEVTFQYDASNDQILIGSSCAKKELVCDGKTLVLNPTQRVMYNTAFKVSGKEAFEDILSSHSKTLCWIISDVSMYTDTKISELETLFTQRYVLTLLHLTSIAGVFGDDEYPPSFHECLWTGVQCTDDGKNKMTSLSLSSNRNQIIGGTLIEEIGSLAFLETLRLSQTGLEGSIPRVFSNLYSLREFNVSGNALTGSVPEGFFHQLTKLEILDLSDNDMTGVIPARIGSYSSIEIFRLNNNKFTGELPLDGFAKFNLKHLDVSENKLSGSVSPSLLKHEKLEHLDLGSNFFVGSLEENIFRDLTKLKYFNVSKNELTGIIPPTHHNASGITHFDTHVNRFTGSLPISISGMTSLEYLNLQGNEITGSIPFELNNLENLHTLVLSHNKFKGSIPLTFDKLTNMNILHLQSNQLSGKAPITDKAMKKYITDCGYPSESLNPVDCPSCSICCNSKGLCSRQSKSLLRPAVISVIFFLFLLILMGVIYAIKNCYLNNSSIRGRFETSVMYWKASDMVGEKSVYHFFLTPNTRGWYVGLFCAIIQMATLFLFINAADIANEGSDLQYTMKCSKNSLDCDDQKSTSAFGGLIFALILGVWLLKDLIGSAKLFLLSMWKKNIDFFFASMILFLVTSLSAWTSVYYNLAIATKDTELIVNAVILLFVNELDERLYQLVEALHVSWTDDVDESLQRDSFHEGQRLNVSRGLHKISKRIFRLRSSSVSSAMILPPTREEEEEKEEENNEQDVSFDVQGSDSAKNNDPASEGSMDLEKETETVKTRW